ncbi:uncharacterized protein RSE6_10872 [Rhynchosporium secalis]|uniref:Uncharacterized protein n=1 Tax=Rhynchosporium secalis TaxID=38038 RepID=A0A1E1MLI7_RHYSE|nr:uncharacterized protein RSE6_10872 [Rhynchosporium secalis]
MCWFTLEYCRCGREYSQTAKRTRLCDDFPNCSSYDTDTPYAMTVDKECSRCIQKRREEQKRREKEERDKAKEDRRRGQKHDLRRIEHDLQIFSSCVVEEVMRSLYFLSRGKDEKMRVDTRKARSGLLFDSIHRPREQERVQVRLLRPRSWKFCSDLEPSVSRLYHFLEFSCEIFDISINYSISKARHDNRYDPEKDFENFSDHQETSVHSPTVLSTSDRSQLPSNIKPSATATGGSKISEAFATHCPLPPTI